MNALAIGGAGAVAAALLGLLWMVLRRARSSRIDSPDIAATAVEQAIPGFRVVGAVVGGDGGAALAVATDNRVAVVVPAGRRIVAREIGWQAVRATADGIVVETGDRRIGDVALAGVDVLDIRRLAPMTGPSPAALAARGIAIGALIDDAAAADVPAARDA